MKHLIVDMMPLVALFIIDLTVLLPESADMMAPAPLVFCQSGLTALLCVQEDPGVACAAMGLCRSQQQVMAQYRKQIQSNEIPQLDLAQNASPFLLNVPQLLFPQDSPKQEAPKPKAAPLV